MDNSRMSTADMLQYCNEALAWEEFGPVDVFFFESVKKIILGQCTPFDNPEDDIDDLMGIERPVGADELAPDYDKYADEYYYEDGDENSAESDIARTGESAFEAQIFNEGFFDENEDDSNETEQSLNDSESPQKETSGGSFTVNI